MNATDRILEVHDVQFCWPERAGFALSVSAFELAQGETVLLLGESGSGKSTLLNLICGVVSPQAGQIRVAGTDLETVPRAGRDALRAEKICLLYTSDAADD